MRKCTYIYYKILHELSVCVCVTVWMYFLRWWKKIYERERKRKREKRKREREREEGKERKEGREREREELEWKSEHCHQLSICCSLQLCTIAVFFCILHGSVHQWFQEHFGPMPNEWKHTNYLFGNLPILSLLANPSLPPASAWLQEWWDAQLLCCYPCKPLGKAVCLYLSA